MGAFTGPGVFVNNGMYLYIASLLSVGYAANDQKGEFTNDLRTTLRPILGQNLTTTL